MKDRLLIVDDHDAFRKAVRSFLEDNIHALDVYEASTAEMAVTKAACIKPNVVLMDIHLPGESGFHASRQIKEDNPDCRVIILTMFEVDSFKKMADDSEADEFVGKSEVYKNLLPAVDRCLKGQLEKK